MPLAALQIAITKGRKIFLALLEPQFQWGRKRELFGSSACNHDYESHPLLVRKSGDWDTHSTLRFWPSAYFCPVITRKFRDYVTSYEAFKGK